LNPSGKVSTNRRISSRTQPRGIVEAHVDYLGLAGKGGAGLVGMAADGDDVVEGNVLSSSTFFERCEEMSTPASAITSTACGFSPWASMPAEYGSIESPFQVPRPPFGHLAAAGVSRAEFRMVFNRTASPAMRGLASSDRVTQARARRTAAGAPLVARR
jgi:hypothetical protein